MDNVVIGMDPHKRSMTIEVLDAGERVLGKRRFATDAAGFAALMSYSKPWPRRVWAIEGCNGIGRHVAMRLVDLDEKVVEVPLKLSARLRMFDTRPDPRCGERHHWRPSAPLCRARLGSTLPAALRRIAPP